MMDYGIFDTNSRLEHIRLNGFLLAAGLAVIFCLYFALPGASAERSIKTIRLEGRINPNDASPASLMRLPGLGLAKAQAIVTYRDEFRQSGRGDLAFRDCNDLDKVKGIGPATADDICKWLKFE
jgi:competence ComEA-like helix-hairpin-helix protein